MRFLPPILCALALFGCGDRNGGDIEAQVGPNPDLPEPHQYLIPPVGVATRVEWGSAKPAAPVGMEIHALAVRLAHPRMPYVLPNGDVLIVESSGPSEPVFRPKTIIAAKLQAYSAGGAKGANRITLLRDADGDGRPELRVTFLDKLVNPFGIVLVGNDLYVANTDAVVRYPYSAGQTRITAPGTKLTDLPGGPINHHWTKTLVASPDGTKLYVGVGSNSNITENGIEAEKGRAAVWEIDRATGASRIFASGLRNPSGLAWEPHTGALWALVNERDELGPDLVPDYMTSVRDGGFYGWPYSYFGQHLDPRVRPQRPDLVARATKPDYALGSHVAPLGLAFYAGGSLPTRYHDGLFVGEHGSWNRGNLSGYKVVFIPFASGRPNGKPQDVVTGFLTSDGHARGRPVGLAIDRTGALLIADDLGDTLWRLTTPSG
ncbi:sorbosone dehydrogenase family protein [Sphingosinicellaceae bacterium]|nr:sorbosone dehydrogenase family protein [Sphingosinicellaceae bacterium]